MGLFQFSALAVGQYQTSYSEATFPNTRLIVGKSKARKYTTCPRIVKKLLMLTLTRIMQCVSLHACSLGLNLQPPCLKPCHTHFSTDCGMYYYICYKLFAVLPVCVSPTVCCGLLSVGCTQFMSGLILDSRAIPTFFWRFR